MDEQIRVSANKETGNGKKRICSRLRRSPKHEIKTREPPSGEQIRLLINKDAGSLKDIKVSKRDDSPFP